MYAIDLIPDRIAMLDRLPKGSVGAEIGVHLGDYAKHLAAVVQPKRLYLVDVWLDPSVMAKCKSQVPESEAVVYLQSQSPAATALVPEQLDWVYVDADHRYPAVSRDLEAWGDKLRVGGLLCGHDLRIPDGDAPYMKACRISVMQALLELLNRGDYRTLAITDDGCPSFMLEKLR